jgi:Tol biopolymer transport system component
MDVLEGAERVTGSNANDQLLYFTSTSVLADDDALVIISDRTGHPNLFFVDVASGAERQLTSNTDGTLKSYVYFGGTPYRGFGKASVCLDPHRGLAYFVQGRNLCVVDMRGHERVLTELPPDQMTAFTHVSEDGLRLCVPTTDARALEGAADRPSDGEDVPNYYETQDPPYDVDERVQIEGLSSYLRVYDTDTGEEVEAVPVPRAWITHVQFSPVDASLILYNHEYCADPGVRRLWLWDGTRHRMLRDETPPGASGATRTRRDWITHETWERDGSYVVYHGGLGRKYHEPPCIVGRVTPDGSDRREVQLPDGWNQYGHYSVGRPGLLVSDGYYRTPETSDGWGQWISLASVDWDGEAMTWQPLTRHGSSWTTQDDHPHPIFDHACAHVYFTSDHGGVRNVYRIAV